MSVEHIQPRRLSRKRPASLTEENRLRDTPVGVIRIEVEALFDPIGDVPDFAALKNCAGTVCASGNGESYHGNR